MAHEYDYFVLGVDSLCMRDEDREVSTDTIVDLFNVFSSAGWVPGCGPSFGIDFWEPLLER